MIDRAFRRTPTGCAWPNRWRWTLARRCPTRIAYRSWGSWSAAGDNAVWSAMRCSPARPTPMSGGAVRARPHAGPQPGFHCLRQCAGQLLRQHWAGQPGAGRPALGARFPVITVRDQVRAHAPGLTTWAFAASALSLAVRWAAWLRWNGRCWTRPGWRRGQHCRQRPPFGLVHGLSEAQRLAIAADPNFRGGDYPPHDPPDAGRLPRAPWPWSAIAARFRWSTALPSHHPGAVRQRRRRRAIIRGWLRHHGRADPAL